MKQYITTITTLLFLSFAPIVAQTDTTDDAWKDNSNNQTEIDQTISLSATHKYGGIYPTDNNNYTNVFTIGGIGAERGLKIYKQSPGGANTFSGAWWQDTYVFEMTDANSNDPDGAVIFGGTGKDDTFESIMTIKGNKTVGIGTVSPEGQLHISDPNTTGPVLVLDGGSSTEGDLTYPTGDHLQIGEWDFANDVFTERMRIKNNGNVGIGVTNPVTKLQVDGTIRSSKLEPNSGALSLSGRAWGMVFDMNTDGAGNNKYHWRATGNDIMVLDSYGKLGIGTTNPDAMLTVNGDIHATEIIVDNQIPTPDYVFEDDFDLKTIEEKAAYVAQEKHLPAINSAAQMDEEGVDLLKLNYGLLQELEEAYRYIFELNAQVKKQDKVNENILQRLSKLEQ